jgi:hypothetical protein
VRMARFYFVRARIFLAGGWAVSNGDGLRISLVRGWAGSWSRGAAQIFLKHL